MIERGLRMNLDLRPVGGGLIPLRGRFRGLRAFDYSAITDCSMLTAFQRTQAPQCGGSAATTPVATYQAPTNLQTPSNCIDPASGLPFFTPECVNANLAIEAANQAKLDAANRTVFVQNCNNAWELNRQQYEALGLPVPPNDCAYRSYGQVAPGTTGGSTAYVTNTPQGVIDWRTANPTGGVMNAWDPGSTEALKEFNAPPQAPASSPSPAPAISPGSTTAVRVGSGAQGQPSTPTNQFVGPQPGAIRGYSPNDPDVFPGKCPTGQSPGWEKFAGTQSAGGFWPDNTIPTAADVCCGVMGAIVKGRRMTIDEIKAALASGEITAADLSGVNAKATFECGSGGGFDWKSPVVIVGGAALIGFLIWQASR
jgi:hypothetical protein